MTKEFIYKIAEKLGIPTAFLVVTCFAIYLVGSWTGRVVIEPLINRGIDFLAAEQESMEVIAKAVDKQTDLLRDIRNDQRSGVWRSVDPPQPTQPARP